jgi:hypothetical protein
MIQRFKNIVRLARMEKAPEDNKRDYLLYTAIQKLLHNEIVPCRRSTMGLVETWDHGSFNGKLLTSEIFSTPKTAPAPSYPSAVGYRI